MNLEGFSKRGMELGDDPEGIKRGYQNNLTGQYKEAIDALVSYKINNDSFFDIQLGMTVARLSSLGLNVTRESILNDVKAELQRRRQRIIQFAESLGTSYEENSSTKRR